MKECMCVKTIREQLLEEMKHGTYHTCERLPRENVLAKQMKISRTQLRDVLASLEREGFITRRHGVGTIINHHVLQVNTRMDIEIEFLDMIRANGYHAALKWTKCQSMCADETVARLLRIPEGTNVLQIALLCSADGTPAIYCENYIEAARVRSGYTQTDLEGTIFEFLGQYGDAIPYMDLTNLNAVVADQKLAELLSISVGVPVLKMEEVDYDLDGKPVFCALEYFREGVLSHTVMRKKL